MAKKTKPLAARHQDALAAHGLLDRLLGGDGKINPGAVVELIQTLLPLLLKLGAGAAPKAVEVARAQEKGLALGGLTPAKILALIKALIAALESSGILDSGATVPDA